MLPLEFAVEITPIALYIGSVFPFMGSLSFLFLDDFEGNANISVVIKSSSTIVDFKFNFYVLVELSLVKLRYDSPA